MVNSSETRAVLRAAARKRISTPALDAAIAALRDAKKEIDGEGLNPPRQLAGHPREGGRRLRSREERAAEKDRNHD